jgi:hypothetical protein
MVDTSYRVIPRAKHRFDVEMAKPSGSRTTIEGFASEHEANAWIVQAQRLIRAATPWAAPIPRRAIVPQALPALPPLMSEQPTLQSERNHAAARRSKLKLARERSSGQT